MSTLTLPEDRRRRPAWQRLARLGGQSNRTRRVGFGGWIWLITAGVLVLGVLVLPSLLPHVEAARLGGLGRIRVAFKHVLPGSFSPLVVTASLDVGNAILLLASLSFLGLGSPDGTPELGAMTANGLTYLLTGWWVAAFPAVAVTLLALVGNFAGDTIRDLVAD